MEEAEGEALWGGGTEGHGLGGAVTRPKSVCETDMLNVWACVVLHCIPPLPPPSCVSDNFSNFCCKMFLASCVCVSIFMLCVCVWRTGEWALMKRHGSRFERFTWLQLDPCKPPPAKHAAVTKVELFILALSRKPKQMPTGEDKISLCLYVYVTYHVREETERT